VWVAFVNPFATAHLCRLFGGGGPGVLHGTLSVSESNVGAVSKYIGGQEEHHKKHSFQEEFVAFLKKHRVPYDERYVWD
jgi:hypothetical protein